MAKRPSYRSIRVRQTNIVEGMGTGHLRYAETAKRLGVSTKELRRFLEQKPRAIHANYNRSPGYSKLFESGRRANVREKLGLPRITRYEFVEHVISEPRFYIGLKPGQLGRTVQHKAVDLSVGRRLAHYWYKDDQDRYEWAVYANEHGIPISIDSLALLKRNKRISTKEYERHIDFWQETYNPMQIIVDKYRAYA